MNSQQQTLPTNVRRAHRNHDYVDLFPGGVFPTGELDVLERGGSILFIKSYEYGKQIKENQRKIYKSLVQLGELEGAKGPVTVVCVWGLGETPREIVVFDYMGESKRQVLDVQGWRRWLHEWWSDNKKRR